MLPKAWADKNGLSAKSPIYLKENERSELVVSSRDIPKTEVEEVVDGHDWPFIWRVIGFNYMYGTTRLRLYSHHGFTEKQIEEIDEGVRRYCMGFEITRQGKNEVLIEDILNTKEMSERKILSRMRYLIDDEFDALLERRPNPLGGTEGMVDRHFLLGARYLTVVRPEKIPIAYRPMEMMEMVSDELEKLSRADYAKTLPILKETREQFRLSIEALKGDRDAIDNALTKAEELVKKIRAKKLGEYQHSLLMRVTRSIEAIAETGISQSISRSEELVPE